MLIALFGLIFLDLLQALLELLPIAHVAVDGPGQEAPRVTDEVEEEGRAGVSLGGSLGPLSDAALPDGVDLRQRKALLQTYLGQREKSN